MGKEKKRVQEPEVGEDQCETVCFGHSRTNPLVTQSHKLIQLQASQHSSMGWDGEPH